MTGASCTPGPVGTPIDHAWTGYTTPQGHLGWMYAGPHADYRACLEQSVGHVMLGVLALIVGIVAGVLMWPPRSRTEHETSLDWRAMEAGAQSFGPRRD